MHNGSYDELSILEQMFQFIIPKYHEAHDIMTSMLDQQSSAELRIADLGSGFGDLSQRMMDLFPNSMVFGIEREPAILQRAMQKLESYSDRFIPENRDLNNNAWMHELERIDAVVSSFTLDYLTTDRHQQVVQEAYDLLSENGRWISCEFFRSQDNRINRVFHDLEMKFIQKAISDGKVSQEQVEQLSQSTILRNPHHVCTVEEKIEWLSRAGFRSVDIPWKFLNLAVVSGVK
ncbi:MAG: methyltransferase domain-containing protein [candidate division KSB1 bacterium]|nr:methyltransferase domain-containing protein [candidate division KSB1 bacterium]